MTRREKKKMIPTILSPEWGHNGKKLHMNCVGRGADHAPQQAFAMTKTSTSGIKIQKQTDI